MKHRSFARQTGFTLVEIAIVLVIIGLLLGGVLKGQEMIGNAKTKSIVNDMKAIQAAYNGYMDRFKAIPGDEALPTYTARGWASTVGGTANGILAAPIAATFTNAAGENQSFWQSLRASGLLSGDATAVLVPALPTHSSNGTLGIAVGAPTVYGLSGTFVCASNLSTKQAAAIDVIVDGPLPPTNIGNNAGTLRAATGAAPLAPAAAAPAPLAYNETITTGTWTVCMQI